MRSGALLKLACTLFSGHLLGTRGLVPANALKGMQASQDVDQAINVSYRMAVVQPCIYANGVVLNSIEPVDAQIPDRFISDDYLLRFKSLMRKKMNLCRRSKLPWPLELP
jgi:hypothetical protein